MKDYMVYQLGLAPYIEDIEEEIKTCLNNLNHWQERNPRLVSTHADGNVVYGVFECDEFREGVFETDQSRKI